MIRVIRRWIAITCLVVFLTPTVVYAETRSAKDYMGEGIRAAYHNMNLLYEAYYDDDGNLEVQPAGHVAIEQEWDGDKLTSRTYLDENGMPINRIDGYSKAVWGLNDNGVWNVAFYDRDGNRVNNKNLNLVEDIVFGYDGWTKWLAPKYDTENCIINIGNFCLGDCSEGDLYTCTLEVEFRNVSSSNEDRFTFRTAGLVDDDWNQWQDKNFWNFSLLNMDGVPDDGRYSFAKTVRITNEILNSGQHGIGFRCDYWDSGEFRIGNLKIEKSNKPSLWTPGV